MTLLGLLLSNALNFTYGIHPYLSKNFLTPPQPFDDKDTATFLISKIF